MPQRDLLLPWRTALDNACLALELKGTSRAEARRRALPLFQRFGLAEFTTAPPYELSGGMRQRVAFVRTLLTGKPVLLLDEPFGSLDALTRSYLQEELLGIVRGAGTTTLLVTHDIDEALLLADRVVVISSRPGRIKREITLPFGRDRSVEQLIAEPDYPEIRTTLYHLLKPEIGEAAEASPA
jgi:ABC-type nitrate/sulfonate/bicarbonate transport system ATPase subunit